MTENGASKGIRALLGNDLVAIYRVGLTDDSTLSDVDLIVVTRNAPRARKVLKKIKESKIDIRKIFAIQEFQQESQFLPYLKLACIEGEPIPLNEQNHESESLIKIAGMFFYAFLRNYYRQKVRSASIEQILVGLNDFEYAVHWLPEARQEIQAFIETIRNARKNPESVSRQQANELLSKAIDFSWQLIEIINQKLETGLPSGKKSLPRFRLRENTVFLNSTTDLCRERTERSLRRNAYTRKIFLPMNFAKIISQPEGSFSFEYVKRNLLGPRLGQRGWLKHFIKMII